MRLEKEDEGVGNEGGGDQATDKKALLIGSLLFDLAADFPFGVPLLPGFERHLPAAFLLLGVGDSAVVLPVLTTYLGPHTAAAGLIGII